MRINPLIRAYIAAVMIMRKSGLAAAAVLLLLASLYHAQVGVSILAAGERCVRILLPSLYLYSILAGVVTRGGLLGGTGRSSVAVTVLLSQIGGYPLGAQLVMGMLRSGSISRAEAKTMLCVCVGCGPGFLLGTVCGQMPLQARIWMMLSVSVPQVAAALMLLRDIRPEEQHAKSLHGAGLVTASVEAAASAMLKICSMVMAMAGAMAIAEGLGLFRLAGVIHAQAPVFLRSVLEVSCITEWIAQGGSLPVAAALLTFGGICVHLQIASLCDGMLPWLRFWGMRLLCSAAAYGLCRLGLPYVCREVQTASLVVTPELPHSSQGWLPGACLLLMSVMVLYRSDRVCGSSRSVTHPTKNAGKIAFRR